MRFRSARFVTSAVCAFAALAAAVLAAGSEAGAVQATAPTATAVTIAIPSGLAMPTTAPAGYKTAVADDFTGTSLNTAKWAKYNGQPGNDPAGAWLPSHDVVSAGTLTLKGYHEASNGRFTTGGVRQVFSAAQTYGQYMVRARMGKGKGVAMVNLLWPVKGWPPEIDFAEDNGDAARTLYDGILHYNTPTKTNAQKTMTGTVDLTQWHTYGVIWSPGNVSYTLDGQVWASYPNQYVSSQPMYLAMQTQAWPCGVQWENCRDSTTPAEVDMNIDWVVAYTKS
jgi:beta-glucanase (GH16 family)